MYLPDVQSVGAEAGDLADDERARSIRQRQLAHVVDLTANKKIDKTAFVGCGLADLLDSSLKL